MPGEIKELRNFVANGDFAIPIYPSGFASCDPPNSICSADNHKYTPVICIDLSHVKFP